MELESEYSSAVGIGLTACRGPVLLTKRVPYSQSFSLVSRSIKSMAMELALNSPSDHQDSGIVLTLRDPLKRSLSNVRVIWL